MLLLKHFILPLSQFYFLRDSVDSEIVEHSPICSGTHLIRPRRPELSGVRSVIVDPARVDEDGVGVEQAFACVDLILQPDQFFLVYLFKITRMIVYRNVNGIIR